MILRMAQTLAEFGPGFAFAGLQYPLDVDGDEFCIDQKFLTTFAASLSAGKLGRSDQRSLTKDHPRQRPMTPGDVYDRNVQLRNALTLFTRRQFS